MPGHSFEDRQRKAGYSSFVRAPVDRTPAPTRGTISFGSSDPAKKSNREFNEELERQQREQEQKRGTPLTGQDSTVNTQEQIQNLRNIGIINEPEKTTGIDTVIKNVIDRAKGVDFTFPGILGAFQNLTKEIRPTADSFKNKNFLAVLENEFRKGNFNRDEYYDTYKDLIDEVFDVGLGSMDAEEMFNTQTVGAFNEAVAGDLGSDIQQRVDPIGFGRELLDRGGPQPSGQAEEFAKIDLSQLTNSPEDRRLAAAVMEARALAADKQSRQDANKGQGIMAASPALPGLPFEPPSQPIDMKKPIPPIAPPVPVGTGITPFNINQFYASLPQYTQQGIMAPTNLSRFTDALRMFPGATV